MNITLAHGNGGRHMQELIAEVFVRHLHNPLLDTQRDAALLPQPSARLLMTSDSFTVQPLEFPGGDIGALAVHGTVNDLAVAGAQPLYLSLNAIIEEGLPLAQLERLIASLARTAQACDVAIVTGDTKVVPRGAGGGLYLTTTGVGILERSLPLGPDTVRSGDCILVSGPVGDHGVAVLVAREEFGLSGAPPSDMASVLPLTRLLLDLPGLRFMRDPTRGGLAGVAHDIHGACGLGVQLSEAALPVSQAVRALCEMLGYDPLYLASEGRVVAVVAAEQADTALARWRAHPQGHEAAVIGRIDAAPGPVWIETALGGRRVVEMLQDDPLPRIC